MSISRTNRTDQQNSLCVLMFCTLVEKQINKEVGMTTNQIAYWKLQEEIRSNKAKEEETKRSNVRNEQLKAGQLDETVRHNTQDEGIRSQLARGQQARWIVQSGTDILQTISRASQGAQSLISTLFA